MNPLKRSLILSAVLMPLDAPAIAQRPAVPVAPMQPPPVVGSIARQPGWPVARPEDVSSIDSIVHALYDVISGPAGDRDWDRFRSLFTPSAILVPMVPTPDGSTPVRVLTAEDYIARVGPFFGENPFYEVEAGRTLDRYGNVANAMSAYESRRAPGEEHHHGDDLVVRATFSHSDVLPEWHCGIKIENHLGHSAFGVDSRMLRTMHTPLRGSATVEWRLEDLRLGGGQYFVHVFLAKPNGEHIVIQREAARFVVHDEDKSSGIVWARGTAVSYDGGVRS